MVKPYYQCDGITIYCCDAREIVPELSGIDLTLTDPPYGVSSGGKVTYSGKFDDTPEYVQNVAVQLVNELRSKSRAVVVTPGIKCLWLYERPDSFGVIYYPSATAWQSWGTLDTNPILYYGKPTKKSNLSFTSTESRPSYDHPCPKPMGQWRKLLGIAGGEGLVCDPFMGTGTTLVAAKLNGRPAVGIEIEEKYCEIAANRLAQGVLF